MTKTEEAIKAEKCERRIVVAAIKIGELIIFTERPGRHHTALHAFMKLTNQRHHFDQGFVTSDGLFVSRDVAFDIAKAAGQIIKKTGGEHSKILFSEDLW